MKDYFFIYRDTKGNWGKATNIEFIAKHKACRAILKKKLLKEFKSIKEFINGANSCPMPDKVRKFAFDSGLHKIQYKEINE